MPYLLETLESFMWFIFTQCLGAVVLIL